MRHLYWKIFLWFWLAMVVLALAIGWATREVAERTNANAPASARAWVRAGFALQRARRLIERRGPAGLRARLDAIEDHGRLTLFVLGARGDDLYGRALPPALASTVATPGTQHADLFAGSATGPAGHRFRLLALLDSGHAATTPASTPPPARRRPLIPHLWWAHAPAPLKWTRLAVAIAVSGLVCLLLARYLTGPLRRLRAVSLAVAKGELGARAGPPLTRRRDELGELARAFDTMAEGLETRLTNERRLLADVSHELRTPLARLMIAVGLARRDPEGPASAALDRIELEAERLDELLGRILTVQRLGQPGAPLRREPVDLAALAREVANDAAFESSAGASDESAAVRVQCSGETRVDGDAALLRIAFENVIRNALRYAPRGTTVSVTVGSADGFCTTLVRDRGPGVAPGDLEHLFEPFFRVDGARERQKGGHGLGLAITARVMHRHGGTVRAYNAPDGGLAVELRLPSEPVRGGQGAASNSSRSRV